MPGPIKLDKGMRRIAVFGNMLQPLLITTIPQNFLDRIKAGQISTEHVMPYMDGGSVRIVFEELRHRGGELGAAPICVLYSVDAVEEILEGDEEPFLELFDKYTNRLTD